MVSTDKSRPVKLTEYAHVSLQSKGNLSSLFWVESPLQYERDHDVDDRNLYRVHYSSLNFRDVMLATGKLPVDAIPGYDSDWRKQKVIAAHLKSRQLLLLVDSTKLS